MTPSLDRERVQKLSEDGLEGFSGGFQLVGEQTVEGWEIYGSAEQCCSKRENDFYVDRVVWGVAALRTEMERLYSWFGDLKNASFSISCGQNVVL
ncbi:hypothetical protein CDAR_556821 [Caerostris darwini]|uniref:Uncharacterized protein n=1 Tax=Caerostris darwini TaxID=1538125 RepID=A0AAV4RDA5_9ARAC|nr:hypothetical protein CDAR_556821 [Caerostris darwini]